MSNTPAAPTTPRTEAGRRLITMLAQIDPEPQGIGWVRDAILAIEAEARSTPAEALDPHRLGGLIERAIRESRRKNGLIPDGWTLVEMALAYSPETPTEPSLSPHNREADHE